MSLARSWGACIVLAAAACDASPGESRAGDVPNLVLVSIDSLRWDHVGCYGYPRDTTPTLDRLAAEGVRFETALSTTSWTLPSHAAMFTGLYDSAHGLVDNGLRLGEGHRTLAEVLSGLGYRTAGFFGGPYLHPTFGLDQGFDDWVSCMSALPDDAPDQIVRQQSRSPHQASHGDVTGPRTRDAIGAWLDGVGEEPFFLFVHLWDVHYDYIPPPEYLELFDPGYEGPVTGVDVMADPAIHPRMDPRDFRHLIARYDGEIRFTDDVLGEVLADLERRGHLEDALVAVTADHGEEFFDHGWKGHQRTLFDEVVRVPLVLWWPGRLEAGRVVREQVRLIDLMPTLVEAAGGADALALQGRSLLALLAGRGAPAAADVALCELLVDRRRVRALRSAERKLVFDPDARPPAPRELLFDLRSDAREHAPLAGGSANSGEHAEMLGRLERLVQVSADVRERLGPGAVGETNMEEVIDFLREVGYVGGEDP